MLNKLVFENISKFKFVSRIFEIFALEYWYSSFSTGTNYSDPDQASSIRNPNGYFSYFVLSTGTHLQVLVRDLRFFINTETGGFKSLPSFTKTLPLSLSLKGFQGGFIQVQVISFINLASFVSKP